ncbi:MAG: HlyD family efflux transporter periplasmic adaptor subunit [Phycisphaerae bacterium]|nr:HlyD family efflux transporter periplasmic adaptor subunit [Phycisphaerae bacterium]
MIRWISILFAVVGLTVAVLAVRHSRENPPDLPLARPASVNPFERGVAALGLVEPASRTIDIVAPEPGLVVEVGVDVGDHVKQGQALFKLDSRVIESQLTRARAAVPVAEAAIARWHALPRKEDLPPLEAAVASARSILADREELLKMNEAAAVGKASNARELSAQRFAAQLARSELSKAEAELAKATAGGWEPDRAVAQAELAKVKAEVAALELLLDRLSVRAPRDAVVLRRSIEPGEFAPADPKQPSLILGDLDHLRVRAQVDEEDLALVSAAAKAIARTRGAQPQTFNLRFVRIEPYARPKSDLFGTTVERVDTRVVDVLYDLEPDAGAPAPTTIVPGQALDVFIEAGK